MLHLTPGSNACQPFKIHLINHIPIGPFQFKISNYWLIFKRLNRINFSSSNQIMIYRCVISVFKSVYYSMFFVCQSRLSLKVHALESIIKVSLIICKNKKVSMNIRVLLMRVWSIYCSSLSEEFKCLGLILKVLYINGLISWV